MKFFYRIVCYKKHGDIQPDYGFIAGPPGIPVLKTQNPPMPKKKFPKIPVR